MLDGPQPQASGWSCFVLGAFTVAAPLTASVALDAANASELAPACPALPIVRARRDRA